jgi:hypothetical protein
LSQARPLASAALACLTLALAFAPARSAGAFVPEARRLADAAGRANYEAGRTGPLRLDVALYTEPPGQDVVAIARGSLLSDPNEGGRVRLELVGQNGVREVQLGFGARVQAWRDGGRLEQPRIMAPPLPLLQVRYGASFRRGLGRLGVDLAAADLARTDGHDCFVIGGHPPGVASERFARRAAVWLDSYSYDVVRVDRADGVRFRFGPVRPFGSKGEPRLPGWVAIEEEGRPPLYLEFLAAGRARPGPGDFRMPQNP